MGLDWCLDDHPEGKDPRDVVSGHTSRGVGLFTAPWDYRGKLLHYVSGLDPDLVSCAYNNMTPDEMSAYADKLDAALQDGSVTDPDSKYTLQGAIAWLRFWSGHGFSLYAWY